MIVKTNIKLAKLSQGKKYKDGKPYIMLKVHDEVNATYISLFGTEDVARKVSELHIENGDDVVLTLDISQTYKGFYVTLVDIDLEELEV